MSEEKYVYLIEYSDESKNKQTMVVFDVDNEEDAKKTFAKYESPKSIIRKIKVMSEYDYKHML